jgi:hypothetical protein
LQSFLLSTDKRQGTISVVPEMAQTDSGYSRSGIANNKQQRDAGAKAQH